ncbi:GerMN domain-containing protein [Plantactinospora sp. B5E13]|uniref:GerMN domain-containing protein n=1 Tax=Plantactinospora sp. B5E13 TaxID=3153758 RepID=UPI00325DF19E
MNIRAGGGTDGADGAGRPVDGFRTVPADNRWPDNGLAAGDRPAVDGWRPADEEVLRRILAAHAERIEPAPTALPEIQRRIRAGRRGGRAGWWPVPDRLRAPVAGRRWSPLAAGVLTVAAVTVAALAVGLAVGLPPERTVAPVAGPATPQPPPSPPGAADPAPAPSDPATVEPVTPSAPPSSGTTPDRRRADLAVYYLGGPADRPRLYREFHRLWVRDGSARDRVTAAVRNMLDGPSGIDPDYRTGWPVGTDLRAVTVRSGVATVDLAGVSRHPTDGVGARLAVQQLVWTVTAVRGVTGVRLRLDGAAVDRLWNRVDVSGVLRRAPAVDVLAPVWVVSPQHGDTVAGSFEVHLAGILPEATAQLRVSQDGRTVHEQVVTLSVAGPAQGEKRVRISLPPGRYTLTAYATSLADGSEQHHDDHLVTVR